MLVPVFITVVFKGFVASSAINTPTAWLSPTLIVPPCNITSEPDVNFLSDEPVAKIPTPSSPTLIVPPDITTLFETP